MKKRLLSMLLTIAMVASFIPIGVFAESTDNHLTIAADYAEPITIKKTASLEKDYNGLLTLAGGEVNLERDYAQNCDVTVTNNTDAAIKYYLECLNVYDDIAVNFVKGGSVEEPLVIQPGETQKVELSAFMQNSERSTYQLPVYAHISNQEDGSADSKTTVTLVCTQPVLNIDCSLKNSDQATLTQTYQLVNNGEALTDVNVFVEGEAEEYTKLLPVISNYQLNQNDRVDFKVSPDLTKMKNSDKTIVSGKLIIKSGGQKASFDLLFDTQGKEITTTTMGELALIQDGNPYAGIEFDEDSFKFTTKANGTEMDFKDITSKYYEDGNTEKDGVNTTEELGEVFDTIINPVNAMIDFSISDTMVYEGGNIPVFVHVYTEAINVSPVRLFSNEDTQLYYKDNTLTSCYTTYLTPEEYTEFLKTGLSVADYLKIQKLPENILGGLDSYDNTTSKIALKIDTSINSAALSYIGGFTSDSLGGVDIGKLNAAQMQMALRDMDSINKLADATQPLRTLGKAVNYAGTIVDTTKVYNVWQNPNPSITTSQKLSYTSLQIAKNVNTYVGGKLLSKAGTAIGTAIGDGPGAVVGYFAGYVVSGLIGYGLGEWIKDMEGDMSGSAIYYDVYGHQCTNRGLVQTDFYVPDFEGEEVELYDTGRMYDGSYVNSEQTNYQYYLNGKEAGISKNGGLTEVSIAKIPTENLKPGEKNTIVRDYDTNPGSHFVTADSEITIIYPSDTEISYIGTPNTLEDVRLHPDFAVYNENIFASKDEIVGEASKLNVNVYNRGSQSGWVTISIKDGETEIYKEENCFIKAFDSKNISVDWTPAMAANNISVSLINASIGLNERKTDNNGASKTVYARERQIPEISGLEPSETIVDTPVFLSANITKIKDIKNVVFLIDDIACTNAVESTTLKDGTTRYYTTVAKLDKGEHTFKVEAEYHTTSSETSKVSQTASINVTEQSTVSFSVDETIKNPVFYLKKLSSWNLSEIAVSVEKGENNLYSLKLSHDMFVNPETYYLFVKCDDGLTFSKLSDMTNMAFTLNGCKAVKIESDDTRLAVKSIKLSETEYYLDSDGYIELPLKETVLLPSGEYELYVGYDFEGLENSTYISINIESADIAVNLNDYIKTFKFTLPDETFDEYEYVDTRLFFCEEDGDWDDYYLSERMDIENKSVSCVLTSYAIEQLQNASAAFIVLCSNTAIYKVDIMGESIPESISRNNLKKITFAMDDSSAFEIININVCNEMIGGYYLYGKEIYLPKDVFEISTIYTNKTKKMSSTTNIDLTTLEDVAEIKLKSSNAEFIPVNITWPSQYIKGTMAEEREYAYSTTHYTDINAGENVMFEKGKHSLRFILRKDKEYNNYINVEKTIDIGEDNASVVIKNDFIGSIDYISATSTNNVYSGGDQFRVSLDDLNDENGNSLTSFYTNDTNNYLFGYATFTSIEDNTVIYEVPVSGYSLYSLYGKLPNVDGTYSVKILLSDTGVIDDKLSINASAENGGTISPAGSIDVERGDTLSFIITPNSGYKISDVWIDGTSIGAVDNYSFENITASHSIVAKFSRISSGGSRRSSSNKPKITKNEGGNVTTSIDGKTVTIAAKDGYVIKDVLINGKSIGAVSTYTFEKASSQNTIEVVFEKIGEETKNDWKNPFSDIIKTDWFYEAVRFVYEKGITSGISETEYDPQGVVTRGQFITMLCRAYGISEMTGDNFSDCGDTWYTGYLAAAKQLGISSGVGDNQFAPDKEITREEMVTLIYNYLKQKEKIQEDSGELNFSDKEQISDWAKAAVAYASANGIVKGRENNHFDPKGKATRAELAQIFFNLLK